MSLGALGQYGSDSSISDSEWNNEGDDCSVDRSDKNTSAPCVDPLSLCGGQTIDSDSDSSSHSSSPPLPSFPSSASRLPLPDIESIVAKNASYSGSELHASAVSELDDQHGDGKLDENKSSVFSNPYERAEEAKMAMLKKHVIEFDKKPTTKGSSPPPFRRHYKKRVGRNSLTLADPETHKTELFDENDSSQTVKKERKHRSGVTDSLQPPKKFMKMYDKIYTK